MAKNSNVALGFLVGAAAGAILGILYAPDKGSKTRRKIAREMDDYREKASEKMSDTFEGVKEEAEEVLSRMKTRVGKLEGDLKRLIQRSREGEKEKAEEPEA
ncbi:MAG: hypothetical protein CSA07_02645 [Bacteroidia bacterium]|nr:MAG: hypothetical protein CSA07_02645 [Bacteroidia bacterium]